MCVLDMFNFATVKLHSLHLNCFCFMWLATSIKMPKKSNYEFTQGKTTLSLHVCFKCASFYKCEIAFTAFKLLLFHVVGSIDTVDKKKSSFASNKGKTTSSLHVCFKCA